MAMDNIVLLSPSQYIHSLTDDQLSELMDIGEPVLDFQLDLTNKSDESPIPLSLYGMIDTLGIIKEAEMTILNDKMTFGFHGIPFEGKIGADLHFTVLIGDDINNNMGKVNGSISGGNIEI